MWYMQIRMNTHVIYFCMLVFLAADSISLQGYYDEQCSANSLVYLCSLIQRCPDPIFLFFYFLKANLRQTELSFTPKWGLLVSVLWSRSLRENFQISVLWSRSLRRIPNLWSLISISEGKFPKMCMSATATAAHSAATVMTLDKPGKCCQSRSQTFTSLQHLRKLKK